MLGAALSVVPVVETRRRAAVARAEFTRAVGAYTDLTAGRKPIIVDLSPHVLKTLDKGQRYLGVRYLVTSGPLTAGAFTAYLSNSEAAAAAQYPSGFTVA